MPEKFACDCCGDCCHGTGGIVLRDTDAARLAVFLRISVAGFFERYAEEVRGKRRLRTGASGACIFAAEDLCGVHEARPDICRAWPFFRGNLVDAVSFSMAAEGCAGLRGIVSHADFVRAGARYLLENGIYHETHEQNAPTALMCSVALRALLEER